MPELHGKDPDIAALPHSPDEVKVELERILASQAFRTALRPSNFLRYAVLETLEGRGDQMKEYSIAIEVFGREESFDPRLDPIVRVEATKLRSRLATYYSVEGRQDPLRIELPKRGYVPVFREGEEPVEAPAAASATSEKANPVQSRSRSLLVATGLAALVVLVALSTYGLTSFWNKKNASVDALSIAVLPFSNLGDDRADEYFSDGLTDELIASLGRVPGLRVVARGSVFQLKGKNYDIRELGRRLGVRTVLEGSVRKFDNRLRITAHLDDATNGYRIWSNIYERDSKDALTIQRDIALALVNSLGVQFEGKNWASRLNQPFQPTASVRPEAYQAYLKGLFFWNKNTAASIRTAMDYFEQARAIDPGYAPIYAGLGRCYTALPVFTATSSADVIPKIRQVASKALELDPNFGEAHLQLGEAAFLEYDWAVAERELKMALELSPGDAVVHRWYSYYLGRMGRLDEELAQTLAAQELDPVSPYVADGVAHSYVDLRRYSDAIEQYKRALALEPNFAMSVRGLGMAYLYQGNHVMGLRELQRAAGMDSENFPIMGEIGYALAVSGKRAEAQTILARLLQQSKNGAAHSLPVAQVYIGLDEKDHAFEWLEKAVDQHEISLGLKSEAMFDALRSDPRFGALLRQMKLSQ